MKLRLRFTVRTLAIFVTVVCAYLAAWEATNRFGVEEVRQRTLLPASNVLPVAPLTIRTCAKYPCQRRPEIRYYLWLFGPTIKLSVESQWKEF